MVITLGGPLLAGLPAEAAWLAIAPPVEVARGWTRIGGRYSSVGTEPQFRATARCGNGDVQVLDSPVQSRRDDRAVWLDLPGTPERFQTPGARCATPTLAIEMVVADTVVASAPIARPEVVTSTLNPAALEAPPQPAKTPSRFALTGQKFAAPSGKRTEAGVSWALDSHVSLQLNVQRTAEPPMMAADHDDGILTRLRVGF